mmetsp:Transcript_144701/g.463702  ORF Transcript_144701/g.463702 Transcript_144701/m.463702 type:complete len:413 (+) Transcript_144701:56-1294(+)
MKFSTKLACLVAALAAADAVSVSIDRSQQVKARRLRNLLKSHSLRATTNAMAKLFPFYHTSDAISDELKRLAGTCPGMTLQTVSERNIDVVTIRAPGASPTNKNFLLFGEHARELISPESGLHLIKSLCGETDLAERAKAVLQDSEFQIVVNGNPVSRRKVETGDFCLRVSPTGVDLNRNWDEHWQPDAVFSASDTNPGPKPFSEPETQAFRELVTKYQPTTFLTIHSGTRGMYMPWAFDMQHLASRNEPQMMEILRKLDKDHCQCPFGAAGREVGYSCPGTCLDWVYDELKTPYAFAFEIYVDSAENDDLKSRWEEKMAADAFIQTESHLGHSHFKDLFEAHPTDFVQLKSKRSRGKTQFDCFAQFNPSEADEFQRVVENWSAAYLDMSELIVANLKKGIGNSTGVVSTSV